VILSKSFMELDRNHYHESGAWIKRTTPDDEAKGGKQHARLSGGTSLQTVVKSRSRFLATGKLPARFLTSKKRVF
jgi:hypothetical protein